MSSGVATRAVGVLLLMAGLVAILPAQRSAALERVSRAVALGFTFPSVQLDAVDRLSFDNPAASCILDGSAARMAVLGRIAEDARRTRPIAHADSAFVAWIEAIEQALICRPVDGYAWLSLYWALMLTEGPSRRAMSALDLSHRFAPNEGWIAVPRVRTSAFSVPLLTPDGRERLASDVRYLVQLGRTPELVFLMSRAGIGCRDVEAMIRGRLPAALVAPLGCQAAGPGQR